ncbi:MAG TPA: hypothetical protein VN811_01855 [Thermoanaerobaculia bacterium]|nr:hypothetical protein [Thermoanaerobaculia bacterium]
MTLTKHAEAAGTGDVPPAVEAETPKRVTAPGAEDSKVTKVVVAVHGVGDQHNFATIQSVVNQFCTFHRKPAAIPLGKFHNNAATFSMKAPFPAERFQHLAFAEVYWADVPRRLVESKHKLEEAKKWAGTIVGRLRMHCKQEGAATAAFGHLKLVLDEMIETLGVLERLCFLASKAGLFDFDLKKLLDDYLGDVQVVTEFEGERDKILTVFRETLEKVYDVYPKAEIYVVSHSEGTVVSFLGLLAGIRAKAPWVDQVRGLMTFGSPLDKHLLLWPELFDLETGPPDCGQRKPIEWRNYYDKGDPIASALDAARVWLWQTGWIKIFNFERHHDIGFIRYPFPGKAHVDYWNDEEIFSHFIATVVQETPPEEKVAAKAEKAAGKVARKTAAKATEQPATAAAVSPPAPQAPRDIRWKKFASYLLPYVGVATLLFVAVYVLFKAVRGYTAPGTDDSFVYVLRSVGAIAILLLGITVTARIPRLTSLMSWHRRSWLAYLACVAAYLLVLCEGGPSALQLLGPTWVLITSLLVVILVYLVSRRWPKSGLKPLLAVGGAAIVGLVAVHIAGPVGNHGKLWPVVLGAAGFSYLWWLSALLFDLVFAWHLYIRRDLALQRIGKIVGSKAREDRRRRRWLRRWWRCRARLGAPAQRSMRLSMRSP